MDGISVNKSHLRFMIPFDGVATTDSVRVTNNSDVSITFKMKTTTDKAGFIVQPKTGIVKPGASREINITYKHDIDMNPRLRLDVVPFNTPYELTANEFWNRREAVIKHGNKESKKIALASLPLYKYHLPCELVKFDEHIDLDAADEENRPRAGLVFKSTRSSDSIELENHSDDPVTFRVRSTDESIFSVQPSKGVIAGNGCTEVFCLYNGGRRDNRKRHFFQVEIANQYYENPTKFWTQFDMDEIDDSEADILKHRFKVHFEAEEKPCNKNISFNRRTSTVARGLSFRAKKTPYGKNKPPKGGYREEDDAMYAAARTSLPTGASRSPAYRKRPTSHTFSRVWGSMRRQPTFLSSRSRGRSDKDMS